MTLNQRLILLLLLGLTVTSGADASLCISSEDLTRCVCNVMVIHYPQSLLNCFNAVELELRDGKLDVSEMDLNLDPTIFQFIQIDKLIFNNVRISSSFISAVLPFLSLLNLKTISIISSTVEVVQPSGHPEFLEASTVKALVLEDVTVDPSLLQPSFQKLHRWLFGSLKSLVLVRSGLVEIDCSWAHKVENLAHLDLSENPLSFTSLQKILTCPSLSFKYLKSLHLRYSNLSSLLSLCTLLSLTPALTELDVSGNNFSIIDFSRCPQVNLLRMLNLSHSRVTEVHSLLFTSLEELDLSYNSLETFSSPPQTLRKLNLSNNRHIRLHSLHNLSHLQELKVDSNQLAILIKDTGANLSTLEQLELLYGGKSPYQCDCARKEVIVSLDNADTVFVEDFPEECLCASPVLQQITTQKTTQITTQIKDLSLEMHVTPTAGTRRHSSPLCLTLFMGLLSHLVIFADVCCKRHLC
ncbi:monocyte differentiation antigen CD14-like [Epinephelus fuscoguttatus]|uniref:monocyte differentiation antigen CD14-like n=1 Tax=Epinephelus fuscoguttatus TaxID=293821 RepID=UPI0020D1E5B3|nr:monocyte differentiation antigen CD14-like [Epinephelus fuscoguttatus]